MNAILLLSLVCQTELAGHVIGVSDGDTITLIVQGQQLKIRLASIDAPEKSQPFGQRAKQHLSDMVFGKDVRIETYGKDRYGRTIGTVFVGETNVNRAMIESGYAWQYRRYDKSIELFQAELNARESRIGLWSDRAPIPPWKWRRAD